MVLHHTKGIHRRRSYLSTTLLTSTLSSSTRSDWGSLFRGRNLSSVRAQQLDGVPKERVDCVVIGAGVVGLAVARELACSHGRQVLVVDSAPTFGTGTSSRNSEVIHAGIYYPTNSLKALFCVKGREMLYNYCKEHDTPHKQIGKLIVATRSSEVPKLTALLNLGMENGVDSLRMMEGHEAMSIEPELQCVKALLSPLSGIVDTHSFMLSLVECYTNVGLGGS